MVQMAAQPSQVEDRLRAAEPTFWVNPCVTTDTRKALQGLELSGKDLDDAQDRWARFAPLISELWPNQCASGRIRSALQPLRMAVPGLPKNAKKLVKRDDALPVCASIKARGGFYEVLARAEEVARQSGQSTDSPVALCAALLSDEVKQMLSKHEVAVGSTGNLGMSVGLAATALGMQSTVHMSKEAKDWKKSLLREHGVTVKEHEGLYGEAVAKGREEANSDSFCHFVDDESSTDLFLGYSAAGRELKEQLREKNIPVDSEHPLIVYLPCGVGGAPAGICWGLKHSFGPNVHVFFVEPTQAPCVCLGLFSDKHDGVTVQDYGLTGETEADGLAVSRPSGLACRMSKHLVSGVVTVADDDLFKHLALLMDSDKIFAEPSCCSAFSAPQRIMESSQMRATMENGTHVFWLSGGGLVPVEQRELLIQRGRSLLATDQLAASKL
mmetsp:Transcript_111858/g.256457  ORF Transcript_111858/g.256457 Transcript_111858/m.256457 type:complete len:441 (-) Transcript_111858:485-1807(-)